MIAPDDETVVIVQLRAVQDIDEANKLMRDEGWVYICAKIGDDGISRILLGSDQPLPEEFGWGY